MLRMQSKRVTAPSASNRQVVCVSLALISGELAWQSILILIDTEQKYRWWIDNLVLHSGD